MARVNFSATNAKPSELIEVLSAKRHTVAVLTPVGKQVRLKSGSYLARRYRERDPTAVEAFTIGGESAMVDLSALWRPRSAGSTADTAGVNYADLSPDWLAMRDALSKVAAVQRPLGGSLERLLDERRLLRGLFDRDVLHAFYRSDPERHAPLLSAGWPVRIRCVALPSTEDWGDWIDRREVPRDAPSRPDDEWSSSPADSTVVWVPPAAGVQALLVVERAGEARATLIPADPRTGGPTRIHLSLDNDEIPDLRAPRVELAHDYADPILGYLGRSDLEAVRTLASTVESEEALAGKHEDVVAACVGAYGLLAANALDRMHHWSANLFDHFPELGDAAAIHGEWLARMGRHAEAGEVLLSLDRRGLPWFTDGLLRTLDRLRQYLGAGDRVYDAAKRPRAAALCDRLDRLVDGLDLHHPVLSWIFSRESRKEGVNMSLRDRLAAQTAAAVQRRNQSIARESYESMGPGSADERASIERALVNEGVRGNEASALAARWKQTTRLEKLGSVSGSSRSALERILGADDLLGVEFLEVMVARARAVGRIVARESLGAFGTGFLIGRGLLMTNHHVFSTAEEAALSAVQFDYQLDISGNGRSGVLFHLEPARCFVANEALDYAIVAVAPRSRDGKLLADFGEIPFGAADSLIRLQAVVIVQHPLGAYKKIALRENQTVESRDATYVRYVADTHRGSSGAPVFNLRGDLVALHHTGVPRMNANGQWLTRSGQVVDANTADDDVDWVSNEGIVLTEILRTLRSSNDIVGSEQGLLRDLAAAGPSIPTPVPTPPETVSSARFAASRPPSRVQPPNGAPFPTVTVVDSVVTPPATRMTAGSSVTLRIDVPLEVEVRLGTPARAVDSTTTTTPPAPSTVRRVGADAFIDQLHRNRERIRESRRAYYNEEADRRAMASYYEGIDSGATRSGLYDVLSRLVQETHSETPRYRPANELYPWVDLRPDGTLQSIYSASVIDAEEAIRHDEVELPRFEAALEGLRRRERGSSREALAAEVQALEAQAALNCEHVVPQSWFDRQEPMRGDLHHLFACETKCNGYRGNNPYGDEELTAVERAAPPSNCGELRGGRFFPQAGRGAVARAILYFLLRYPGEINRTGKHREYEADDIAVFLKWHDEFPPDIYEKHRNVAIEERQGNRNPFVDHPEWASRVDFGKGLGQ